MVPLRGWAAHAVTPSDKGTNLFCLFWWFTPETLSIFSLEQQEMGKLYFKTEKKISGGKFTHACMHRVLKSLKIIIRRQKQKKMSEQYFKIERKWSGGKFIHACLHTLFPFRARKSSLENYIYFQVLMLYIFLAELIGRIIVIMWNVILIKVRNFINMSIGGCYL